MTEQQPDFISEDDLDTWEGYLRYQGLDPVNADPKLLAQYRQIFDQRPTIPKVGLMKLGAMAPGEQRYAVAHRAGSDLWLTTWVRRAPKGDVYVITPRADSDWDPHESYHRDGTFHSKSFDAKQLSQKRQPLDSTFKGAEQMVMLAGHAPKQVGAVCDPGAFTEVVEVPPGILGPIDGFVVVDLCRAGSRAD